MRQIKVFWGLLFFLTIISGRIAMAEDKKIVLETNQGNVVIRLFPDIAPRAVENFTGLIKKGYYNGIIFHRVIKGFMIQGGDPTGTGMGGESIWGRPFEDEVSKEAVFDRKGLVAMANAGPNTNGSQFFIMLEDTPLPHSYTIFGRVVSGEAVVDAIGSAAPNAADRPLTPVVMTRVSVSDTQ